MIGAFITFSLKTLFRKNHSAFLRALRDPARAQDQVLKELLSDHEKTEYGKSLGLHRGMSREEFRDRTPVSSFDDPQFKSWIEKQKEFMSSSILSPGGVRVFEKTSGSSGAHKLIPYNKALLASFQRYCQIWTYDALSRGPRFTSLKTYISISPGFRSADDLEAGIGLEDDTEYLSWGIRFLMKPFLAAPFNLKFIQDPHEFRTRLCAHLVSARNLEIISVWHPSFFLLLWEHLLKHRSEIAAHVSYRPARALLLSNEELDPQELWPKLKFVSAWDSAQSESFAKRLSDLLPHATFQGKGLLATEAPMSLPLIGVGNMPFVGDVLFELIDENGKLHWFEEAQIGSTYTLLISQRGGLLRYAIQDQVTVRKSSIPQCPSLEFVGRAGDVSDLVGEKLASSYLKTLESELTQRFGYTPYCFLPLMRSGQPPHYTVLVDSEASGNALAEFWEEKLSENFHYDYAKKLGQLGPIRVVRMPDLIERIIEYYRTSKGMKIGDVKIRTLLSSPCEAELLLERIS